MAIDNFVPEFWSTRLRRFLDSLLVYAQPTIMNRNWEGEIQDKGDTVHINRPGDGATVKDYVRNTDMDPPERPDGDQLTLIVDQEKYTNSAIDDVDAVQVNVALFDEWSVRTARNIRKVFDSFAAAKILAGADPDNIIGSDGTPVSVKADGSGDFTPYQLMVEARRVLDNQDAPDEGRWAVINPDLEGEFLLDPTFITGGGGIGDASVVRNGMIGRIAGFDLLKTTRVPTSPTGPGSAKVEFGAGNYGLSWADQITKMEGYRIERQFGDAMKTLNVYGAKVVEGESIGVAHVEQDLGS